MDQGEGEPSVSLTVPLTLGILLEDIVCKAVWSGLLLQLTAQATSEMSLMVLNLAPSRCQCPPQSSSPAQALLAFFPS